MTLGLKLPLNKETTTTIPIIKHHKRVLYCYFSSLPPRAGIG